MAIVGGGFSGLLTAIHLLRGRPDVRVRLIERTADVGRGRAYSTNNPDHLLNVRASNMSAFPDQPDHFRQWLGEPDGDAFVSRRRYGDYLQGLLHQQLREPGCQVRFVWENGEAASAAPQEAGIWRVRLGDGRTIDAGAVVLALGFLPAAFPAPVRGPTRPSIMPDPWSADLSRVPAGEVLLVGTGLTMVDAALSLDRPERRLTALSRRGLAPLSHGAAPASPAPEGPFDGPLIALRTLRLHAAAVGWRSAVDSVRAMTPDVWQGWSLEDRRRFLRHLRPWWDIHRHRMAPSIAARFRAMREAGRLRVVAGRVEGLTATPDGVEAVIRNRGQNISASTPFAAVINCASPRGDIDSLDRGLVTDLRLRGLLRGDPLGLGLDVERGVNVVGQAGSVTPGLFAVGPLTRGAVWEAAAVPDLRNQTAAAADAVLAYLRTGEFINAAAKVAQESS